LTFLVLPKNIQVQKVQSDQDARVPKHGNILALFDPVLVLMINVDLKGPARA
jgi:hypothetical protein